MTDDEFHEELDALQLTLQEFTRICDVDDDMLDRWIKEHGSVPTWAELTLRLIEVARKNIINGHAKLFQRQPRGYPYERPA